MGKNIRVCIYSLGLWLLLMVVGCEKEALLGEEYLPGEIEVEGIELSEEKEYPRRMHGTLPSSGGFIMMAPEPSMSRLSLWEPKDFHYNNPYHHYTDPDFQFELPVTDFTPELSIGGEWFGANEWIWVEFLALGGYDEYMYIAYIDANRTGEFRTITFHFIGAYRVRDIIIVQPSE